MDKKVCLGIFLFLALCGAGVFVMLGGEGYLASPQPKVSAFLRVKNEIKTLSACLKSIDGVFDRVVILFYPEKDDGSIAHLTEWCRARKECVLAPYPHEVYPSHDARYQDPAVRKSVHSLAAYYNHGLALFEPDEWVVKIDADQVYLTNSLKRLVAFLKMEKDPWIAYGIKGYNTFSRKGVFVSFKPGPINGGTDSFIIRRRHLKGFLQGPFFEKKQVAPNVHTTVLEGFYWFHFLKRLAAFGTVRSTDETTPDEILPLSEEQKKIFEKEIRPLFRKDEIYFHLKTSPEKS